ncbi:hypothetical protein I553_2498 [Mycobacterium xenopi 4042]|nr:hypothetical protein I553_2498 [Mycobacterium xenopi 4042]
MVVAGFAVAVAGALVLARFGEAPESEAATMVPQSDAA